MMNKSHDNKLKPEIASILSAAHTPVQTTSLAGAFMTIAHTLGFPRIGAHRELKQAQEAYWRGEIAASALAATGVGLPRRRAGARRLARRRGRPRHLFPEGARPRAERRASAGLRDDQVVRYQLPLHRARV